MKKYFGYGTAEYLADKMEKSAVALELIEGEVSSRLKSGQMDLRELALYHEVIREATANLESYKRSWEEADRKRNMKDEEKKEGVDNENNK